jgi:hypothetical protein
MKLEMPVPAPMPERPLSVNVAPEHQVARRPRPAVIGDTA